MSIEAGRLLTVRDPALQDMYRFTSRLPSNVNITTYQTLTDWVATGDTEGWLSAGLITIPRDGFVLMTLTLVWPSGSNSGYRVAAIERTGGGQTRQALSDLQGWSQQTVTAAIWATAGLELYTVAQQGTGAPLPLVGGSNNSSFMSFTWLGVGQGET